MTAQHAQDRRTHLTAFIDEQSRRLSHDGEPYGSGYDATSPDRYALASSFWSDGDRALAIRTADDLGELIKIAESMLIEEGERPEIFVDLLDGSRWTVDSIDVNLLTSKAEPS